MFYFQLKKLDIKNSLECFDIFKSNNFFDIIRFIEGIK